jgi:hypothetical protein
MNKTLMGMTRSMMQFKGLSTKYWVEVVHTAVYLRNRSPTSALDGKTPYEAWYNFKPKVNHLRVFGSTCYALVPKEKRTKLENQSMKCTFIGCSEEKKGYRLLSDGKFIVSRDVIFYEIESNGLDEINHLLSCLDKKNNKDKGKFNKSKQAFWFEKDLVTLEDISLSKSSFDSSDNESKKYSSDTESSKVSSPTSDILDERRASIFENPLFNNNGDSDPQSPQHKKPKWAEQLLKDVYSDEMNKIGTRGSSRVEANFAHASIEPTSFAEAAEHKEWQEAMINEYDSVLANGTWNLVDSPQDVKPIGCKWVYLVKYKPNGKIDKYKARLVAKGFSLKGRN